MVVEIHFGNVYRSMSIHGKKPFKMPADRHDICEELLKVLIKSDERTTGRTYNRKDAIIRFFDVRKNVID